MNLANQTKNSDGGRQDDWQTVVGRLLKDMKYGSIQIVVHDSRVVQIERVDRIRMDRGAVKALGLSL